MADRAKAIELDRKYKNSTFEKMIKHKENDKNLSGDDVWRDIIRSAQTPNHNVNKEFGIE